eukprot:Nitzschia sp. Nitz4//scaffold78_size91513//63205//64901//NITZ4_004934-RA/size91513-snap-gene-0.125-mRNA-1//1//CDS//3329558145//2235//frame0
MEPSNSSSNLASHTYVAGEDELRLQESAQYLGLNTSRAPMTNVRIPGLSWYNYLQDNTVVAARMHSVGALGQDERIDNSGTIHIRTLQRRNNRNAIASSPKPNYGTLQNLFQPQVPDTVRTEEEEVVEVEMVEGGSLTAAVFGIIKGTIGPAILYLPHGFTQAGFAVAIASMLVATASFLYSAIRLLQCWKAEKTRMQKLDELRSFLINDGGAAPTPTLLTYPELARRALGSGAVFVRFGIASMQLGVCLTYFIFVPQNLVECTKDLFHVYVNPTVFLVLMLLIEIPLCWIRDIRKLMPTNVLATLLMAYGLACCLILAFWGVWHDPDSNMFERIMELPPLRSQWYLFVGTSFFVFEGSITLLVPLQEAVVRPADRDRFSQVNVQVTSWIVVFYVFFAVTCWASFGDSVRTALTASLPPGIGSTLAQLAYSVAVILTFPLQAFPALGVMISPHVAGPTRTIFATLTTCLLALVAYVAMDSLSNVVSLLGSLVGIPIALIFPPLMHNRLGVDMSPSTQWTNYVVASIGVFAMGATSYSTIVAWND